MSRIDVDVSELRRLQVDLGRVPEAARGQVRRIVQRAAFNIKKDLVEEATGASEAFDRVRYSISYDTYETRDGMEAEIGPELGHERGHSKSQGSLAWIAYEGHARTAPVFPDPAGALDREAEAFQDYLARAVAGELL